MTSRGSADNVGRVTLRSVGTAASSLLLVAMALSGCTNVSCPAVMYIATIPITSADADVASIVCIEGCFDQPGDTGLALETNTAVSTGDGEWQLDLVNGAVESVTFATYDAGGVELARHVVALEVRALDPGPCPGPVAIDEVALPAR